MNNSHLPEQFTQTLAEYISFKSVSTDKVYLPEIAKTVDFLTSFMEKTGAAVTIIKGEITNPVVFGHYFVDASLPTVLIYGHYDVQPAEHEEEWSTEHPFKLEEKNGRMIARGIVDNKGQNFIHLYTVSKLFQDKQLNYNVKFLLEGNEESGNTELSGLLGENKELLSADYCIVSDGEIAGDHPTLEATLRGGANMKVNLTTSSTDLHSGIFGGATPSSTTEMVTLLSKLFASDGTIAVPGFYDGFPEITAEILENNKTLLAATNPLESAKTKSLKPNLKYDFYTHIGLLPTLEISGIVAGYTGPGFANILPRTSEARINLRSVPPQNTKQMTDKVVAFLKENTPEYVDIEVNVEGHGDGSVLNIDNEFAATIKSNLTEAYKKPVLLKYVGGSIPILKDFQEVLGIAVISVSFGNDDCNMHGIDENFKVDLMQKALNFSNALFKK